MKQEDAAETIDLMEDDAAEEKHAAAAVVKQEPTVKLEPRAAAAIGPPPPAPRQRASFTVSGGGAAAAAAASSSSAAAAAASSSAAAAPSVLTASTLRARLQQRPRSILDYLCSLDRPVLDSLYTDTFTCLTIFRSLHPLAKQYLLRWLFVTQGVRLSVVESWVMNTAVSQQAHRHAMSTLWELQLLIKGDDPSAPATTAAAAAAGSLVKSEPKTVADVLDPLVWFNPPFQKSLQDALCNRIDASASAFGGGSSDSAASTAAAASDDPDRPSLQDLDEYATDKWDAILHYMVGATRAPPAVGASKLAGGAVPTREVTARLISMGLMEISEPSSSSSSSFAAASSPAAAASAAAAALAQSSKPHITPSGFAFLFKDMATQVWDVILTYMDGLDRGTGTGGAGGPASTMDRDDALHFLFRLSFLKLGVGYPVRPLTPTQRRLLQDLAAFGLVYLHQPSRSNPEALYYPTKLALNLSSTQGSGAAGSAVAAAAASSGVASAGPGSAASASSALTSSAGGSGYILLETTFRLYAFTTSPFHAALLGLFCRLDIRLPNLLVGTLTKESVRGALKSHISAREIISYLESYAHAMMKSAASASAQPILPENVTDQLKLWEAERNRMSMQDSFLFEFDSNDSAEVVRLVTAEAYRTPHNLILHHVHKKLLVVTPEGYQILKNFKIQLNKQIAEAAEAAAAAGKQL